MADLTSVYAALQKADAAGDTAGAKQLADYIRNQPTAAPAAEEPPIDPSEGGGTLSIGPFDTGIHTPQWLDRGLSGAGELYSNLGLGAKQLAGLANKQDVADRRALDAPLNATVAGKVGQFAAALPAAFIPGANTYLGAGLIGGALGGLQPVAEGESRTVNTAVGGVAGLAGKAIGDVASKWVSNRAAQPFTGWRQATANDALSGEIGAEDLSPEGLRGVAAHMKDVYGRARSPHVNVEVTGQTGSIVNDVANDLSESAKATLTGNKQVTDLLAFQPGSNVTAEQLGGIASKLGRKASSEMTTQTGDRELGQALFAIKDHVDELIGKSITDPELATQYAGVNKMYPTWVAMKRASLFNAGAGDVNPRNFATYLQKKDFSGYALGENQTPLYQMARWGQETRAGNVAPGLTISPDKWVMHYLRNTPVVGAVKGAIGGSIANAGKAVLPAIKYGLPAAGELSPVALPYLTQ